MPVSRRHRPSSWFPIEPNGLVYTCVVLAGLANLGFSLPIFEVLIKILPALRSSSLTSLFYFLQSNIKSEKTLPWLSSLVALPSSEKAYHFDTDQLRHADNTCGRQLAGSGLGSGGCKRFQLRQHLHHGCGKGPVRL